MGKLFEEFAENSFQRVVDLAQKRHEGLQAFWLDRGILAPPSPGQWKVRFAPGDQIKVVNGCMVAGPIGTHEIVSIAGTIYGPFDVVVRNLETGEEETIVV